MANYLLTYSGGGMPEGEAEQQAAMDQWMNWFGSLGASVVDAGSPLGVSAAVSPDGSTSDAARGGLNGYSIISADSLSEAAAKAKGCPVLSTGGSIDVYEVVPIG